LKKLRVVVLHVEIEVGIVLDGKLRHVEEGIGPRVEEEEGAAAAVVGKKIVKTKHVASIEDHAHSDDLKENDDFSFQNSAYMRNRYRNDDKFKTYRSK
jgi:hypothetical protein